MIFENCWLSLTGSRVQCIARAFNSQGHPGKEVDSEPVTIDSESGICMPKENGVFGNNPYQATIRYQGSMKLYVVHLMFINSGHYITFSWCLFKFLNHIFKIKF